MTFQTIKYLDDIFDVQSLAGRVAIRSHLSFEKIITFMKNKNKTSL